MQGKRFSIHTPHKHIVFLFTSNEDSIKINFRNPNLTKEIGKTGEKMYLQTACKVIY